jgi:hypothetical protein
MSQLRFLFDECTDPGMIDALLRREPSIDVVRVGWEDAPALQTLDPDLLMAAETMGRMLVTNDRRSMPDHITDHFAGGRHTHGVALLKKGCSIGSYVEELLLLWSATTAEEWIDGMIYIPM